MDEKRRELRSQCLDLLRFPLAVVVVAVHLLTAEGFVVQGQVVNVGDAPFFVAVYRVVDAFLRGQSVPIYFFIAGYVFFVGVDFTRRTYLQKLQRRTKTLLIPYLLWNTLAVGMLLLKLLPCLNRFLASPYTLHFSWSGLLSCYWMYDHTLVPDPATEVVLSNNYLAPIDVPLWFLRELMIVVVCTPMIYWVIRRTKYYVVAAAGGLWFALGYTDSDYPQKLATAFFFFSVGAYLSIYRRDMVAVFGRYFRLSMVLYPLLSVLCVVALYCFPEGVFCALKQLNVCAGLLFAYNLAAWLLRRGLCKVHPFLASASFFIYVSHLFVGLKLTRLLYVLLAPTSALAIFSISVLSLVLNIGLLLAAYYLLQRYCPALLRLLTGRKAQ